jgi:hypothetical protein
MRGYSLVFGTMMVVLSGAAAAHHGWGSYDDTRKFTITGAVKHLQWQYPHVHVMMDHEGREWTIVLAPISRMQRRGVSQDMLEQGMTIAAEGYPSKRVDNEMRAERITVKGKTFEMR